MVGIKNVTFNNFVRLHLYNNMASMKRDTMDARLFYEQTQLQLADPAILLSGPAKLLSNNNNGDDGKTIPANNNNLSVDPAILFSGPSKTIPNDSPIRYSRHRLLSLRNASLSRKCPISFEKSEPKSYWNRNATQRMGKKNSNGGNLTDGSNNRKMDNGKKQTAATSTIFTDFSQPNRLVRDRYSRHGISGRLLIGDEPWTNNKRTNRSNYNFKSNENIDNKRNDEMSSSSDHRFDEKKNQLDNDDGGQCSASIALIDRYACNQEPEWFNEPSSQKDIIELRGFNDSEIDLNLPVDEIVAEKPIVVSTKNKETAEDCNVTATTSSTNQNSSPPAKSTPTKLCDNVDDFGKGKELKMNENDEKKPMKNAVIANECVTPTEDFNFEDFLKIDSISELFPKSAVQSENDIGAMTPNTQSRFSRWFKSTTDNKSSDNFVDKPYKDCSTLINNRQNSFSCSESTTGGHTGTDSNNPFFDFLHRGKFCFPTDVKSNRDDVGAENLHPLHNNKKPGHVPNVTELESRMRNKTLTTNKSNAAAFNNFIAQMGRHNGQPSMTQQNHQQTMGLVQMLNQNYTQQQNLQQHRYYQLQKQQHEQRQLALQQHFRQQKIHDILNQPEAKMLIQGIESGNITKNMLLQYLNNFKISDRQREIITVILGYFNDNNQSRVLSPTSLFQANPFNAEAHRIGVASGSKTPSTPPGYQNRPNFSPFTNVPGGLPQRLPSPEELKCHTNSIMQNAFMRRKIEEQQETLRKRQEFQQRISSLAMPSGHMKGRPIIRSNAPINNEERKPLKNEMKKQPTGSVMEQRQQSSKDVVDSTTAQSATSNNNLSNWFSSELLAQASAGQLPSIGGISQAHSLEKFEREIQSINDKISN